MALALGIAGFALIAIIGLLTANIQSSNSAKEETVTTEMVQDVLGDLKTQKTFANLQANLTANAYIYYFDANGSLLPNSSNIPTSSTSNSLTQTPPNGAVYICVVGLATAAPPASGVAAPWSSTSTTPPLIAVSMTFSWPASAPTANRASSIVNATLAQF
jgi:hypothetical protein